MRHVLAGAPLPGESSLRDAATRSYVLLRERDPDAQRALIANDVLRLLEADAVQHFQCDDDLGWRPGERFGAELPPPARQMQEALLLRALTADMSLLSTHPQLDPDLGGLAARCAAAGVTTHLLLARADRQTYGVYAVHWLGRERPGYDKRGAFYHYWDTVGITVAAAEERARLEDEMAQLREFAFFDSLTGLPNTQALERELAANDDSHPFAVLALDFDGLREANTALGYTAGGDVLIRAVGHALATLRRPSEFVARMHTAGDEFALLLPGVSEQQAAGRAVELELGLDGLAVPETHRAFYHGASVGSAGRRGSETPGQVLGRAIEQMRARKLFRKTRHP